MNRLNIYYQDFVLSDIVSQSTLLNSQEVSTIQSIALHLNLKRRGIRQENFLYGSLAFYLIRGGRSIPCLAKRGNLKFSIQKNEITGVSITLDGSEAWMFVDRLVHVTLPRLKGFNGIKASSWDQNGDLTFNISDLIAFSELESNYNSFSRFKDLNITVSITSKDKDLNLLTLQGLRFPFLSNTP